MRNIIFFLEEYPVLTQTFVHQQIVSLKKEGFNIKVVSICKSNTDDYTIPYVCLEDINNIHSIYAIFKFIYFSIISGHFFSRINLFKKNCYRKRLFFKFLSNPPLIKPTDIVISHFGMASIMAAQLKKYGYIKNTLYSVLHAYEITKEKSLDDLGDHYGILFEQANRIFSVCEHMRNRIIDLGCNSTRVEVLHLGVDIDALSCLDVNVSNQEKMKIIFVGRLTEKKGLPDLLLSLARLNGEVSFTLDIIGGGELSEYCHDLILKLHLNEHVKMHGFQPHHIVLDFMKNADVLILPSKTSDAGDMEGIPVVLMEAMAMKKIVLSTYHSGITELIENNVNGILVNEGDVIDLSKKILYISKLSKDKKDIIGMNANQKIMNEFNIKFQAKCLANIILNDDVYEGVNK
ncbi:glycosyltransferase [Vibrio spartinae]|uniref:Glycogen synthase n=1 Tax=Vibrio spartinae TaxID=1918945 RepID=A0A1N6M8I5_9VIBR|nr:glycosyltransferase [Vibrio spartinae]SIO95739.1 Glycogen synthase [Vibrio spartinae]